MFWEALPYYLSIGMSADEYWNASAFLAKSYREAYKLKARQANEQMWLQGQYIYAGLVSVFSDVFGKKGGKKPEYPKEPYDLGLLTDAEKAEKAKREREKIIASLTAWKKAWDNAKAKSGETR